MDNHKKTFILLTRFAAVFAFCVILMGAFTRLTDAGLGCPDWPGCYGHIVVPQKQIAQQVYPQTPLHYAKAMTEMVHRYLASTLGLLIVAIFGLAWLKRESIQQKRGLPSFLLAFVILQGMLGMWTVTLKLHPTIVMLHLLGGLTTLSCLWWLQLRASNAQQQVLSQRTGLFYTCVIATIIVALQIALGGWTSSNYAAMVCPSFPFCLADRNMPAFEIANAFTLWHPIGPNFEGGILAYTTRITIQMFHRIGALTASICVLAVFAYIQLRNVSPQLKRISWLLLAVLLLQVTLGISNIVFILPLPVAVAHNGVAAILLLTLLTLTFYSRNQQEEARP